MIAFCLRNLSLWLFALFSMCSTKTGNCHLSQYLQISCQCPLLLPTYTYPLNTHLRLKFKCFIRKLIRLKCTTLWCASAGITWYVHSLTWHGVTMRHCMASPDMCISSHDISSHYMCLASNDMACHDMCIASHDMASHGMASHDMASHDMASHDMASHDMAWHDMASRSNKRRQETKSDLLLLGTIF